MDKQASSMLLKMWGLKCAAYELLWFVILLNRNLKALSIAVLLLLVDIIRWKC
jgi:hypothetical protein